MKFSNYTIAIFALLLSTSIFAQEPLKTDTIEINGTFNGKNIFIKNPFNPESKGFCSKTVYLNGKMISAKTNQSAFEVKLDKGEVQLRDSFNVKITYVGDTKPSVLNSDDIEKKVD